MTQKEKDRKYNAYLETQVKTASREQLLMMLIDGAISFTEMGKAQIEDKNIESMGNYFLRAQKIMLELVMTLDRTKLDEEICGNLTSLYMFVYTSLTAANLKHDPKKADDALKVLAEIRLMWEGAVEKMFKDGTKRLAILPRSTGASQGFIAEG